MMDSSSGDKNMKEGKGGFDYHFFENGLIDPEFYSYFISSF